MTYSLQRRVSPPFACQVRNLEAAPADWVEDPVDFKLADADIDAVAPHPLNDAAAAAFISFAVS